MPDTLVVRDQFPPPHHSPTDKQSEFWDTCWYSGAKEILFDGAIRSGKTQAACKLLAAWAWHYGGPNWKAVVMRKTYRELSDSTASAFFRGDGNMPAACPNELIHEYLKNDEIVVLKNGSQILFRSAEEAGKAEEKIKGLTLAAVMIDQVEELDGEGYRQLYLTLHGRLSDPRGPGKLLLIANPGSEQHWVYQRFVDPAGRDPRTARVTVTLEDNKHNLDPEFIEEMEYKKLIDPFWYRRFVLGEWGAFGGKRFPGWNPQMHVVEPFDIPSGWEIVCGIDFGHFNPTAVVWCAIDFNGRWWVVAEHYESEKPVSYHAGRIKEIERSLGIPASSRWMDPSTWAKKSEYEAPAAEFFDYGIDAGRAQNDRLGGWNRIDEFLSERMEDEFPKLRVFSSCKNLIRELPSLRRKDDSDDVVKERDHAADALRYAIMSRATAPEEELPEEDPQDAHANRLKERVLARAWD